MLEKHNFHWKSDFFYGFLKKRQLFEELSADIDSRQIVSIIGLRRLGKTTLLKQLMDQLIKTGKTKRENILFYSFDEEQPKIDKIIQEFEAILGKKIHESAEKYFIFLDEIQKLDNWQNQIKYYYDNFENIKFFISGSSSLFIKKHVRESLAGRIYEFILNPLSFEEFLIFRNKQELLEKKQMFKEEIVKEFKAYQKRQFVEIVNESEEKIAQYVKTIVEKIVYQDIPKIFPIENEELLIKILSIVASNPGMLSDYENLSKELGISRITLSNYFFYLEESFLIKKTYNFSKNMLTSEKKMKKFYLTTSSFFPFLCNEITESKLIENLAVSCINSKFFWRTPQQYEVDIILIEKNKIIPIEIKYSEHISKKDAKNLTRFCEKFNTEKAIMLTKNTEKTEKITLKTGKNAEINYLPIHEFMLQKKL